MLTKLTVTGFGPFNAVKTNSSELVVRHMQDLTDDIEGLSLSTRVFPVIYKTATEQISETIRTTNPDILILTGLNGNSTGLELERVARNRDNSEIADNLGAVCKCPQIIAPNGPDEFRSSLPLRAYADALMNAGISARISDDAGGFLCNHYYYLARYHLMLTRPDCVCIFVHVPELVNDAAHSGRSTLKVSDAADAILLLARQIRQSQRPD